MDILHVNEVPVTLLHTITVSRPHFESGTKDFTHPGGGNVAVQHVFVTAKVTLSYKCPQC